jgi:hypothetical protein
VEPEDFSEIGKVIREAAHTVSSESRTLATSRFWGIIGFLVFAVVCASGATYFIFYKPTPADPALGELKQHVQELKLEGARKDSALAAMIERVKDVEASNAQLKDRQQKLEAQVKDGQQKFEAQVQETPLLRGKLASLEKKTERLTADFMKLVLAAGATSFTTSFAAVTNRPKLPPGIEKQIEKISPDLAQETKKPPCLLSLKTYGLFCDFDGQP